MQMLDTNYTKKEGLREATEELQEVGNEEARTETES
jgi:hypothetical protein